MNRRRKQSKKKKDAVGLLLISTATIILISFAYLYFQTKSNEIIRSEVTFCREDSIVTTENLILIDATDSFNDTQALLIKKELAKLVENSEIDSKFSIYVIDDSENGFKPIIEICNPGDGSDKSELTSNKRRLLKNWKEGFHDKITDKLNSYIDINVAKHSPIMEILKYASIHSFNDSKASQKKVVIISDLLQHSGNFSQYSEVTSFDEFSKRKNFPKLKADLNDVDVEVYYLYRAENSNRQNRKHISFWEKYIRASGGTLKRVKNVS